MTKIEYFVKMSNIIITNYNRPKNIKITYFLEYNTE